MFNSIKFIKQVRNIEMHPSTDEDDALTKAPFDTTYQEEPDGMLSKWMIRKLDHLYEQNNERPPQ